MTFLPLPQRITFNDLSFTLDSSTAIQADPFSLQAATFLAETLRGSTGFPLPITEHTQSKVILFEQADSEQFAPESFELIVLENQMVLKAADHRGLLYAVVSLLQLFPPEVFASEVQEAVWEIPALHAEDWPRFKWRGFMLDVSRHFMPVGFIKKVLDLLLLHKFNTFHWHLTDDQGWRIEIQKYPRLTEVGAWRKNTLIGHGHDSPKVFDDVPHGGFYTQAEIREVVEYATKRGITIIPEIDLPGHMQAAIAAYPELGNTGQQLEVCNFWGIIEHVLNPSEATLTFLEDVLTEVIGLFPSEYICIGGDECEKTEWKNSPAAQKRMQDLGLNSEEELQSHIIGHMDTFLHEKGRKLLGWDEILEGGLAPHATVLSWRGEEGGIQAARLGHDVIMVPQTYLYLDHYQSENKSAEPLAIGGCNTLEKIYRYNPIGWTQTETETSFVLGTQANLWTEYVKTPEHAQYMMFPRLCALSEMAWTDPALHNFDDFMVRLKDHLKRLDVLGVKYRPLDVGVEVGD
ncbi:beta-N-acetylhexosaminidase [Deinococcus roseus]|uniref:beta-N-acetylhexosaminidase n=1 Tax=Deinococcus roseus TaxID=392414 RepID=A0ABQ2DBH4_9DEIO|nr:beta-N-acetylhexosaminidase [Deinococcus roseus]GGJ51380.1 hypothetical protein GCM10008938_41730 [Deinococcus roseus]